ncbi:hypothetical protein Lalb_Chr02g0144311 [Lupinus albus]|uniref:Uncharacterized protein n=1 Tax=Lupinus albus TaxID=3870 RepID=A0A6A4QYB2_LUPAL|nr:hypothetical protein Lalb_Chr02g0144311 [Lupinus albus]
MDGELQLVESSENVSLVDPSCTHGHSLMGGNGCSNLEEKAVERKTVMIILASRCLPILVEGEPNFDAGAPEDGWEYLRHVRWEANHIPKVKVAKLDRSKLKNEQSAYMLKIPDIPECPEHLLPLKQWEDVFLAEFSALRAACSNNLQPVHSLNPVGNNSGQSASIMNRDGLLTHLPSKSIDQPTDLTVQDKDPALPPENPSSKTYIDQTSSSSPTLPLLSAILAMDSVSRVSMLRKWISLLEPADNTITINDCMWIFALCAAVDAPLHADTRIHATQTELDVEVAMLNFGSTISGRYSEN